MGKQAEEGKIYIEKMSINQYCEIKDEKGELQNLGHENELIFHIFKKT